MKSFIFTLSQMGLSIEVFIFTLSQMGLSIEVFIFTLSQMGLAIEDFIFTISQMGLADIQTKNVDLNILIYLIFIVRCILIFYAVYTL